MESCDYDDLFIQVAGRAGGLKPLLNAFFGFLHRKTDFYVEYDSDDNKATMGFPRGAAEKLLLESFRQYNVKTYKKQQSLRNESIPSTQTDNTVSRPSSTITTVSQNKSLVSTETPRITDEGKQIPIGNGGICDNYYWTQTLKELTVYLDMPNSIIRGNDITCK